MTVLMNNTPILGPDGQPLGGAVVRLIDPATGVVVGESLSAEGWIGSPPAIVACHMGFTGADNSSVYTNDYAGNSWSITGSPLRQAIRMGWGSAALYSTSTPIAAISTPSNPNWSFGTGDFYIRLRIRPTSLPGSGFHSILGSWASNLGWAVALAPTGRVRFVIDAITTYQTANSAVAVGNNYTVEVSRVSGMLRIDVNGTRLLDTACTNNITTSLALFLGAANATTNGWNGHVAGVTIIKGGYITNGNVAAMPPPPDLQKGIYRIVTDHVGELTMVASVPSTLSKYPDKVTRVMV